MRRLAAAVGVSATAFYVYFPDKDSILRAIAEETFDAMLVALQRSQDPVLPPLERLRAGLRCYVRFGLERPDAYRLTFLAKMMPGAAPGPFQDIKCRAADRSFAILDLVVQELMDAGVFVQCDRTLRMEAVWACLHGVTALLLDQRAFITSEPDALVEVVLTLARSGSQEKHC